MDDWLGRCAIWCDLHAMDFMNIGIKFNDFKSFR